MNPNALAGTLDRLQRKQDQCFSNARRVNQPRSRKHLAPNGRQLRRFRYWMNAGFRWQDRTIDALSNTNTP